jgi:beta-glucosidase
LLTDILKTRWGFKGFVVSDWGAVRSTIETANAGLDIEMPHGKFLVQELLLPAISKGQVKQAVIDDKVRRMLRAMFSIGLFDRSESDGGPVDTPERRAVARTAAAQGIVLLKNTGAVLPLMPHKIYSIAVIGPNAAVARVGGGGSAMVRPVYAASPLAGIRLRAGTRFNVGYALGSVMAGEETKGAPSSGDLIQEATSLAAVSDVAVIFVGNSLRIESEGFDRKSLELPQGQDELIEAVAKTNKNTIVVLNVGAPVLMGRWIDDVPAVVDAWFGGEEMGNAIADVLFGDVNPSGKLPITLLKEWKDSPAWGRYPGANGKVDYEEGLYVGYRHFDKHNIEPQFPFGHGLSYTTFAYSDLKVSPGEPVQVSLNVRNSGAREGAEVVQLYVRDVESSVDRPIKELKAFRRVVLKPGETQTVSFALDKSALAFYDVTRKDWVVEPGTFEVFVGASSRDIRLKATFKLTK